MAYCWTAPGADRRAESGSWRNVRRTLDDLRALGDTRSIEHLDRTGASTPKTAPAPSRRTRRSAADAPAAASAAPADPGLSLRGAREMNRQRRDRRLCPNRRTTSRRQGALPKLRQDDLPPRWCARWSTAAASTRRTSRTLILAAPFRRASIGGVNPWPGLGGDPRTACRNSVRGTTVPTVLRLLACRRLPHRLARAKSDGRGREPSCAARGGEHEAGSPMLAFNPAPKPEARGGRNCRAPTWSDGRDRREPGATST